LGAKEDDMKRFVIISALVIGGLAVSVPAPWVSAGEVIEKRTETTTSYSGTVSEVDPSASRIIIRSETAAPTTYTYNKKTTFVDESGNTVTYEAVRNRPVTVYYTKEGDDMIISRVVVTRPTGGVIQKKETTTEEREIR
jgi:hypothetical protein